MRFMKLLGLSVFVVTVYGVAHGAQLASSGIDIKPMCSGPGCKTN